jgi:hypothetical protein
MSTQSEFRTPQTQVADLPHLTVVTEGIPASEHVEVPAAAAAAERPDQTRARRIILALEAVLVLLILGAFAVGVAQILAPTPSGLHMGLSDQAWSEYRAGERAPAPLIPVTPVWAPWDVTTPFAG